MKVKDLKNRLAKFDDNLDVVVIGSELSEISYNVAGAKLDKPKRISLKDNYNNVVIIFGDK